MARCIQVHVCTLIVSEIRLKQAEAEQYACSKQVCSTEALCWPGKILASSSGGRLADVMLNPTRRPMALGVRTADHERVGPEINACHRTASA